ncbi:MAG TPA: hypothetical protein VN698_02485, partial [Bacteroidia bacterium]|nr:hypothetical protein [Bacteroidia bacterium]
MSKKIFLLFAFFMASIFIKAQTAESTHNHANSNTNKSTSGPVIKMYEYPAVMLTEEIIANTVEASRKRGVQEEELVILNKLMHRRMQQQIDALNNPNYK